jgi:hypothetical protein
MYHYLYRSLVPWNLIKNWDKLLAKKGRLLECMPLQKQTFSHYCIAFASDPIFVRSYLPNHLIEIIDYFLEQKQKLKTELTQYMCDDIAGIVMSYMPAYIK